MKEIKNVYLSGLGAIGSAYAARLYDMDPDSIRIIADRERIERYTSKGIDINGKTYHFKYLHPEDDAALADLILIAVKQHHLEQVIKDIRKFVGKDTLIISLLNGISSEEILGQAFGMDKLLYSFCVGTDSVRDGTGIRYSTLGTIVFGERTNVTYTDKVLAVKDLFDRAHIPYKIPEDMIREQWWKFMMNVGLNQISAVLRAPYGVFQKVKEARDLMVMACSEVVELAAKAGINLTRDDIDGFFSIIDTLSPKGKTSMLQDVEARRKTEVEIFAGTVIELGKKYGVHTPVNDMLFKMIRTLEQTYSPD